MAAKPGTEYERLTQRVFDALHNQQDVRNVRVDHNVSLVGITGVAHQIDVYWEFEVAGITHRVVVECKDKTRAVEMGTINTLLGVLADLPGQPRGVVVARSGFQDGAKRLAEDRGITLFELRAPVDADWEGFITGVKINGRITAPKPHDVQFLAYDFDGLGRDLNRLGLEPPTVRGIAGQMLIEREDGSALSTVADVIERNLVPGEVGPPEWREYAFEEAAYIATGLPELPRIRLRGLKVLIELVEVYRQTLEIRLDALVHLILKDLSNGTFVSLDAGGRPLVDEQPRPGRILK